MIENLIAADWKAVLKNEFQKEYFQNLTDFVENKYKSSTCFPPIDVIFSALNFCDLHAVKVVILGQDPYHAFGQANGLCFSVADGLAMPPSLQNIFKEIQTDIGLDAATSTNLESWARQGVLLLNCVLTVQENKPESHKNRGWEKFTDAVIHQISETKEGVVFLLWGSYAKKKGAKIDRNKHLLLESGHPSPLSANRGLWFGNQHFSKANDYLISKNKKEIKW